MTIEEAKLQLLRWQRWSAGVEARWPEGTPLRLLARRRVLAAELRLLDLQQSAYRVDLQSTRGQEGQ